MGAEGFADIARFGTKKLDLLRRFLPFADGTPSHERLGRYVEWAAGDRYRALIPPGRRTDPFDQLLPRR
ncbi:MAG: hypothetical protein ABT940_08465 [Alphaproteobacteria bacterium]